MGSANRESPVVSADHEGAGGNGGGGDPRASKSHVTGTSGRSQDGEVERLKAELKEKSLDLKRCQEDLKQQAAALEISQREVKSLQREMRSLEADRQELKQANSDLHQRLLAVEKELEDIKALVDNRAKELLDAKKPLTKADLISIEELRAQVVALDDEILQAAASLEKTVVHADYGMISEGAASVYDEAVKLIGEPLAITIVEEGARPNTMVNPLLVQTVIQVFLTKFCASKIGLWVPDDPKISDFFATVHEKILRTTWRTPASFSFEAKLVRIFKAVEDIRIAMGEKITSEYIRPFLVPPNSQFDPKWMVDGLADATVQVATGGPIQRVIGTTGFGLKTLISERGPDDELLYNSVLLPNVVVESTFRHALKPIRS
ncbi:hypothetical protein BJ165DRAFT_1403320 [Panaeolus papilionaceus]|nr:hypothetical protein BJ165DRAFT_1403320 [Panaeolus papilionaceus]